MRALLITLAAAQCVSVSAQTAFGPTNIWTVELRTTTAAWCVLKTSREFTRAEVVINGEPFTNAALRLKGGGTSGGAP